GDKTRMARALDSVSVNGLDPGQRIVFAALLRNVGRESEAVVATENLVAKILPEESAITALTAP
ncbi:MAG: hypothetical protein ACOYMN_17200, partial [Roseimicrobium sp.]